jgi:restriction system-associated AAA family ATPase
MRLLRVHVITADTCGGLLDGIDFWLRSPSGCFTAFDPLCLVGPNGAGKSQFLQVLAEIFQTVFHAAAPKEERIEGNSTLQFEDEYLIRSDEGTSDVAMRIARIAEGKRKQSVVIQKKVNGEWIECNLADSSTLALLPSKVVGYTSGDNETLSLPFLLSRGGYADEVTSRALSEESDPSGIPDTRLMLIDYGTHLEVLVANLLLGEKDQRAALLQGARLRDLHSFRCIVQLAHSAAPKAPARRKATSTRKGIQLTDELEQHLDNLQRCATCYSYVEKTETYTFDFLVDDETRVAFGTFWKSTLGLYSALHKLSMLNDLAIPKPTRERFRKEAEGRRFASRLPEPQDEDKVFRFERVDFFSLSGGKIVDYVSLSDGEHQLAQILGTFCMVSFPNVLFLLDEPESHFNPQWRVHFVSRLLDLPTPNGARRDGSAMAQRQDCLLSTHAPFVPSDMRRDRVFIFHKDKATGRVAVRHPDIETYGTTFDSILEECFGVRPPISGEPRREIKDLMQSNDPVAITEGVARLGHSVEKVFLADRLRQLAKKEDS